MQLTVYIENQSPISQFGVCQKSRGRASDIFGMSFTRHDATQQNESGDTHSNNTLPIDITVACGGGSSSSSSSFRHCEHYNEMMLKEGK